MTIKLHFEQSTCTRCGGSGEMPFAACGGACFKCNRAGVCLTPKGRSAKKLWDELLTAATPRKQAWEVEIGERLETRPGRYATVQSKDFTSRSGAVIDGQCLGSVVLVTGIEQQVAHHYTPDYVVGVSPGGEVRLEIMREVARRRSGATLTDDAVAA